MNEVTAFVLLGVIVAVIIIVLVIICIRSTKKQKEAQTEKALQYDRENDFFTKSGYVISKRIKNLIIDNEHEKWMVAGADKIFNYSDVIDVRISENGSQLEVGALSVHTTIKSLSVVVTTKDTLNALVDISIFEAKGSLGLETSSYEYTEFKKIALEQEAFFKAVISKKVT